MARGRTVLDNHVNLSFHSDAPMAPASPLLLAWAAVNRTGLSGKVLGPQEKITVQVKVETLVSGKPNLTMSHFLMPMITT